MKKAFLFSLISTVCAMAHAITAPVMTSPVATSPTAQALVVEAPSAAVVTLTMSVPAAAPTAAHPASVPAGTWFVSGRNLYDPTGKLRYLAGVNNSHWDQNAARTGIPLTGSNAVRFVIDMNQSQATNWNVVDPYVPTGAFPIIGNWDGTCKGDVATLNTIVSKWVQQAPTWTKYNQTGGINIANEWGPASTSSTPVPYKANAITPNYAWRDAYVAAIPRMRLAGYNGLFVVDAGNCGQDAEEVVRDGAAILAADPLHNVLFDVHVYSSFYYPSTIAWQTDYKTRMTAMSASGLPIIIGEFGPAPYTDSTGTHSVGPSPTAVPTAKLIADIKQAGFAGWLAWGYNDNNLGGCKTSDVGWFGMTNYCSNYTGKDSELTSFGRLMVPLIRSTNGLPALQ